MAEIPHRGFPPSSWWSKSVARVERPDVDPVVNPKFTITTEDRVVTAGSCFAQHIAQRLSQSGFSYHVTETAPVSIPEDVARAYNYGTFSARYGNLYTARQLRQLIERSYGRFQPVDDVWEKDGHYHDPFRPQIQPGGFLSRAEFDAERSTHFAAVRRAVEECDVFIFTLGLTEAWLSSEDGAVYPVVPGGSAGEFDPERHHFHNFSVHEVVSDLAAAIGAIRSVNPGVRVLLTVSPVPLIATAADEHVLVATTYSKSVLRVAASMVADGDPDIDYFPSYEIITGPHTRGAYYEDDLREVTSQGVDHVMKLVFRHYTDQTDGEQSAPAKPAGPAGRNFVGEMEQRSEIVCDEESLAQYG
jgi:hypothetical protein